jgi:undecaprenyl diphosphate synthase
LPEKLAAEIEEIERQTRDFDKICVNLLINYGGRQEIVDAANRLVNTNVEITDANLFGAMYRHLPEPDLVIRTGGQQRMSNFMLYQCAYSELFFTDTLWPDFSKEEFGSIISAFHARVRNFGGLKEQNDK